MNTIVFEKADEHDRVPTKSFP